MKLCGQASGYSSQVPFEDACAWKRLGQHWLWAIFLFLGPTQPAQGQVQGKALLPLPHKVQYGKEMVPVRGFSINLPSNSVAEDRFAAEVLSSFLTARALDRFPISGRLPSPRMIVLARTGAVDPLPVPGEQTGPETREARLTDWLPHWGAGMANSTIGVAYRRNSGLFPGLAETEIFCLHSRK